MSGVRARSAPVLDRIEAARARSQERAVHQSRTGALLGLALGVTFSVCFLTGIWSHLQQHPPEWMTLPTGPAGLYRVTQGLHVVTGLVSVPLLLAKLFAVSPHLWRRPPVHDWIDAFERLSLLPLVGGSVFLLVTGWLNTTNWYPWRFFFPVGHWWAAWLVAGAMIVHVAFKSRTLRESLRAQPSLEEHVVAGELTRRGLIGAATATAAVLTVFTAGETVPFLRRLTAFAPRRPDIGPQGFPVNRSAAAAGTTDLASDRSYVLTVAGRLGVREFTVADLRTLPQHEAVLPIACVEGWSASARWGGVRVRDLLDAAGAGAVRDGVVVGSAQRSGLYRSSTLSAAAAKEDDCLLALDVEGEPLHPDHGAPVRLIAPNRPGVLQTKWVDRLEVS